MVDDRPQHEGDKAPATNARDAGWVKLRWSERLAILISIVVIAAITVPRLPPGICFDDCGDLQVASATLGIPHPPGYAGYVTLGYFVTRIPGVDPAYMVSLACVGAGIVAIWLAMMMQVRLGVNAWIAAAVGVALTDQRWVWVNLQAPEVYAPSLAFLAGAAYLLLRYVRLGRRRDLLLAALLFGVALANRAPLVMLLPFFVAAWWSARRRWDGPWRRSVRSIVPALILLMVPSVYGLAYLWVRDAPGTAYNCIDSDNLVAGDLPLADGGTRAKVERLVWQSSGALFHDLISDGWPEVQKQWRWISDQFGFKPLPTVVIWIAVAVVGAVVLLRRCRASAWMLAGLAVQPVIFVCAYQVTNQEANLLPLIWSAAVVLGVALSPLVRALRERRAARVGWVGLLVVACIWTIVDVGNRPRKSRDCDASWFVEAVDLASFPANAVICSTWDKSPPLWYAKCVLTGRDDIQIITGREYKWLPAIGDVQDRPVFYTDAQAPRPDGVELKPFRKMWKWQRSRTEQDTVEVR